MAPVSERSAGVIPFRRLDDCRADYLVIHSANVRNPFARWEFPKGGIEPGESPRQAAAREFEEETGIAEWVFCEGFERTVSYSYMRSGRRRNKSVTFFVAEVLNDSTLRCSHEHMADPFGDWCRWGTFGNVSTILSHDKIRRLFADADAFVRSLTPGLRSDTSTGGTKSACAAFLPLTPFT